MENKNFLWVKFYTAFADKLLDFENDRKTLLDKLVKVYEGLGMKFQKLEQDDSIIDIDPFTVFGMFNKGITEANRIAIIKAFAKEFGVDSSIELPTNFDGIPVLNNLKAVFFGWSRPDTDIDNIWALFRVALQYANATDKTAVKDSFIEVYNKVIKQGCIKWNITMGLYWIRPYTFLNLDSRTRWFIKGYCSDLVNGNVKAFRDVPDAETYLSLCESATANLLASDYDYKNLTELSYAAFEEYERVNKENKKIEEGSEIVEEDANAVHYWIYSPGYGSIKWDEFYNEGIMAIAREYIGDLSQYQTREEVKEALLSNKGDDSGMTNGKNASLEVWQFVHSLKPGDIIFAKCGKKAIIGRGVVQSEYIYDASRSDEYKNIRKVKWTHRGEWEHPNGVAVNKVLTDITPYTAYVAKLESLFELEEEEQVVPEIVYPPYTAENFLNEVFMSEDDYNTLVDLVMEKQNVILQGAPGVGKTFAARRLAYSMMGVQDSERVMMVQFHQSYSYEDFIMGYRPTENGGFILKNGPFYNFCKKAENDSDNDYFFIIDEINRGNLSKIFGELFMLVEKDKRSKVKLQLLYSDEKFSVPKNIYIIGMMNTADRSLAMLDYALRRRFAFYDMKPGFDTEKFIEYRMNLNNPKFDKLISAVEMLNNAIENDDTLGEGFKIGHSYFCNIKNLDNNRLSNIVEYELIPMLKEYWFDEPTKVKDWSNILRSAIK